MACKRSGVQSPSAPPKTISCLTAALNRIYPYPTHHEISSNSPCHRHHGDHNWGNNSHIEPGCQDVGHQRQIPQGVHLCHRCRDRIDIDRYRYPELQKTSIPAFDVFFLGHHLKQASDLYGRYPFKWRLGDRDPGANKKYLVRHLSWSGYRVF